MCAEQRGGNESGAMVQRKIEKAEYETLSPHLQNDFVIEFKYVNENSFIE